MKTFTQIKPFFLSIVVALLIVTGMTGPAKAALPPGFYDLGGGQGVIVLRSRTADVFANDIMIGASASTAVVLSGVVSWTLAGKIAWLIDYFYWMVPSFRIHWCATHYGAPEVYIYTIWGGLPVWADPAW